MKLKHWPTDSQRITSGFGERWGAWHDGVDIGALSPGVEGDPIYSVADGTCVLSKVNGGGVKSGYGYYYVIQHHGFTSLYGHLQGLNIKVGQVVKQGEMIGHMGNTGTSTAAHLHFRLSTGQFDSNYFNKDEKGCTTGSVDPVPYLQNILQKIGDDELTWEQIIENVVDEQNVQKWKLAIKAAVAVAIAEGNMGDMEIMKYLPDLIVKLYQAES